jgi:hypothetical protein
MKAPEPVWAFSEVKHFVPSHGWIRDYLVYGISCTDAPWGYHIFSALAGMALAIGANNRLIIHGDEIPLQLFLMIVGDSGSRKSASINRMIKVISPCLAELSLDHRILYPESCTVEGIIEQLAQDRVRLLVLSEWTEMHAQQSQGGYWRGPEFMNLAYDGQTLQRSKMKDSVKVEDPRVSLIGASTVPLLKHALQMRDFDSGRMARYAIMVLSRDETRTMLSAVEHPEMLGPLRERYGQLLSTAMSPHFTLSDDAWDLKVAFQESPDWKEFCKSFPEHLTPSLNRVDAHIYRIATLYQASMDYPFNQVVGTEAMRAALELVRFVMESLLDNFTVVNGKDLAPIVRLRNIIAAAGKEGITWSNIVIRAEISKRTVDELLQTLEASGQIVGIPHGKDRKYRLNRRW